MLYLYGYQDIKALDEERRARAQARAMARGRVVVDSFCRPPADAEIVELMFGTHCDQIGA
jgi:hypothetical protein